MQRTLRTLLALLTLVVAGVLAACGGDGSTSAGQPVDAGTDARAVLDRTFSGSQDIRSGKVDLTLHMDVSGGRADMSGPVDVRLTGPFESRGARKLPKFDLDLAASARGQDFEAGAESTGDKGFVTYDGTTYVLSDEAFRQFEDSYEQAAAGQGKGSHASPASLGLHPRRWLTHPRNAGEGKVGDTAVIRITGGLDVRRFLDDVDRALARAGNLGLPGAHVPARLTPADRRELERAVKDVAVEVDAGKDDSILRRLKVDLRASDPAGKSGRTTVAFDLRLLDLNEDQDFPEPSGAKPFAALVSRLGGLGLGLGSGAPGSGSGASPQRLQDFADCVRRAGNDTAKAQRCADLLTP